MLEKIRDNWQILTALLLLWSFFDTYYYFYQFGIQIQQYVSVSELILLVLPTILKGISWLLAFVIISFWMQVRQTSRLGNSKFQVFIYSSSLQRIRENFQKRDYLACCLTILKFLMLIIFLIGPLLVGLLLLCTIYFGKANFIIDISHSNKYLALIFVGYFVLTIVGYFYKLIEKNKSELVRFFAGKNIMLVYYFLILFLTSLVSNRIDYQLIRRGIGKNKISFSIDSKKFETTDKITLIGATQTYWFFRNNIDSSNIIFKMGDTRNIITK